MKSLTGRVWLPTCYPEANIHLKLSSSALSYGLQFHRASFSKRLIVQGNEQRHKDDHTALIKPSLADGGAIIQLSFKFLGILHFRFSCGGFGYLC